MNQEIKLKAKIKGIKCQVKAIKASLNEDQLRIYEAKINQFKQEFIVENNISLEDQEELDKYFL